jgi:hypothetical protein
MNVSALLPPLNATSLQRFNGDGYSSVDASSYGVRLGKAPHVIVDMTEQNRGDVFSCRDERNFCPRPISVFGTGRGEGIVRGENRQLVAMS